MQESFLGPQPEHALAFFDADIVYDARERPDGKVWHGHDGMRRAMADWSGVWEDWQVETERYIDAGKDNVLILWRERGRGKESGIAMQQRGASLVTVRGELIVHMRLYVHQRAALEAIAARE